MRVFLLFSLILWSTQVAAFDELYHCKPVGGKKWKAGKAAIIVPSSNIPNITATISDDKETLVVVMDRFHRFENTEELVPYVYKRFANDRNGFFHFVLRKSYMVDSILFVKNGSASMHKIENFPYNYSAAYDYNCEQSSFPPDINLRY